jgi:hypothetical protein
VSPVLTAAEAARHPLFDPQAYAAQPEGDADDADTVDGLKG